ncbi:gluconolaconase, partial [Pseudomonas sp. HMWF005]
MRMNKLPAMLAIASTLSMPLAHAISAIPLPLNTPADRAFGTLEQVHAFYDAMPTGVTVSETGRIFVNFPRWGDDVPFTVGEVRDGKVVAYPNTAINQENPRDPSDGLISVQSVVADGQGRVWLLDTAAPGFAEPKARGAKLLAVDLANNRIVKRLVFPD